MYPKFLIAGALFFLNIHFFKNNPAPDYTYKWVVEKKSSLSIQGETNVNSFACEIAEYLNQDTLVCLQYDTGSAWKFLHSCLQVDIRNFDCHNKLITDNFRETLKADENPILKISLLSIESIPMNCSNKTVKGTVDITLAQATKRITMNYSVNTLPGNQVSINGSYIFSFSDFNLKPPNKFWGLIRTKDRIKVNFHLYFKALG